MAHPEKLHLVTGGTGQLGSHIVEQLRAVDQRVRVVTRADTDTSLLRAQRAELMEGDLRDPEVARRAVSGASIVFHCAARVSDWGPWQDFAEETVTTARNIVEACKAENVSRLLHVSSVSVYGSPRLA